MNGAEHSAASKERFCVIRRLLTHPLFWVILLDLSIFGHNFVPTEFYCADTPGYVYASQRLAGVFRGDVDILRTPVYPAFLVLCQCLFGEEYAAVIVLQHLISLAALFVFYRTAERLLPGFSWRSWYGWGCSILFLYPRTLIIRYDVNLMTESLSVSFFTFFIAVLIAYVQQPSYVKAAAIGLGLFVLIMLRPAFLFLLPITTLLFAGQMLLFRKNRKHDMTGILAVGITFAAVFAYCHCVYEKCGIFAPTIVTAFNYVSCVIQTGLYKHGIDPQINQYIEEGVNEFENVYPEVAARPNFLIKSRSWGFKEPFDDPLAYLRIAKNFPFTPDHYTKPKPRRIGITLTKHHWTPAEQNQYAIETIKANKILYLQRNFQKFLMSFTSINRIVITLAAFAVLLIPLMLAYQCPSQDTYLYGVLLLIFFGMCVTVYCSAQAEYNRLLMPGLPLLCLLCMIGGYRLLTLLNWLPQPQKAPVGGG